MPESTAKRFVSISEEPMGILDKITGHSADAPAGHGNDQQKFEALKDKYGSVLRVIEQQQVRLQNLHVQDGKLFVKGTAPSQDAKNKVWDQIKLVNPQYDDITADIIVDPSSAPANAPAPQQQTAQQGGQQYTVKSGDTLSKLAKTFYGDANRYMDIFNANRDKLNDPNMIRVGQVLTIPPKGA
jgi:LysM repeat protein